VLGTLGFVAALALTVNRLQRASLPGATRLTIASFLTTKEKSHADRQDTGSGCANCRKLEAVAREAAGSGIEAEFVKVTDMKDIMAYDLIVDAGTGHQRESWSAAGASRPSRGRRCIACSHRSRSKASPSWSSPAWAS
jgi:hypothetical protein